MQRLKSRHPNQAGFTLIEIAIVLVIIGLLIGGVLKGQAMIQNAKVKKVVKQADDFRAAVTTFFDKYGMYPGDENKANIPPGDAVNGNGNGQITGAGEINDVFNDLMEAGIISGNYGGATPLAKHVFGGNIQIYWVDPPGAAGPGHYVRFDNLPWDAALEIDTKYDDGVWNTGSIVANEDYVEATTPVGNFFMPL